MRNLKNLQDSIWELNTKDLAKSAITAAAWDTTTDTIVCALGPVANQDLIQLGKLAAPQITSEEETLDSQNVNAVELAAAPFQSIATWNAPCPNPDTGSDCVLSLQYFPDDGTSCLILNGGDIIVVREDPVPGEDKIEIVGSVDGGIAAAAWSPDGELLAICTTAKTLLFMTRDFENTASVELTKEDLEITSQVSVGWGKSETQFKGKRAKALRDPTVPEKVDEGIISQHDGGEISISWRGDGAYVAVSSVEQDVRRVIRVYSRAGVLDSISEPIDRLEPALSWRPAGNLIAGIQRFTERIEVVFFERNGLRHGQFDLRLRKEDMSSWASKIELQWNVDSTVLAVCFLDRIQLWTMGNYHYYLKQEIVLCSPSDSAEIQSLIWHPEKPLRFAIRNEGTSNIQFLLVQRLTVLRNYESY